MSIADCYLTYDSEGRSQYAFSASQITTWANCSRKWAWEYLLGLKTPSTGAQNLGTEVHAQLEAYLMGGEINTSTDAGQLAILSIGVLPPPKHPDMFVEGQSAIGEGGKKGEFHLYGRHKWRGYKDVELPGVVWDHKSTSNIDKWAKTPDDLMCDPQAILYAIDNFAKYRITPIELNWNYIQTRGAKKQKTVHLKMTQEYAQGAFELMEEEADLAYKAATKTVGLDDEALRTFILQMPYNAGHCEAYGGCPYRRLCNLSPEERFKGNMRQAAKETKQNESV